MSMSKMIMVSKKLITALNQHGYNITLNSRQYIDDWGNLRGYITLNQNFKDEETGKYVSKFLYGSASRYRIVLFLRDLWYQETGQELPTDQEDWNILREEIRKEREAKNYGSDR